MAGRMFAGDARTTPLHAAGSDGDSPVDRSTSAQDRELRRMAAFRVREAANRIAVLANNADTPGLREALHAICQRLLSEERALLGSDGTARDS